MEWLVLSAKVCSQAWDPNLREFEDCQSRGIATYACEVAYQSVGSRRGRDRSVSVLAFLDFQPFCHLCHFRMLVSLTREGDFCLWDGRPLFLWGEIFRFKGLCSIYFLFERDPSTSFEPAT